MKHAFCTTAGVFCGHVFMVVLITLVQEAWLGGVGWYESSLDVLALAGFLTALSGAVGTAVASAIVRLAGRLPALIMSSLVVIETTTISIRRRTQRTTLV